MMMAEDGAATMAPTFQKGTPSQIRSDIEGRIRADLYGPAEGPDERLGLGSRRIRDRYLVGFLAPKGVVAEEPGGDEHIDEEDSEEAVPLTSRHGSPDSRADGEDDGEGGEVRDAAKARLISSATGMSFVVDPTVDEVSVITSWGRYERETDVDEDGNEVLVWQRIPVEETMTLVLAAGPIGPVIVPGQQGVLIEGRVRLTADGCRLVTLFLSNEQTEPKSHKESAWLFQAKLAVEGIDGSAVFIDRASALGGRIPSPGGAEQGEIAVLDLQYRDVVEFCVGHGTATHATPSLLDPHRAVRVETDALPRFEVARTDAPSPQEQPEIADITLDMMELGRAEPEALRSMLGPLVDGYRSWIERQRIDAEALADEHGFAVRKVLLEASAACDAIAAGIDMVCDDPEARKAFQFANRAMWQQRIRTEAIAALRGSAESLRLADVIDDVDMPANRSWRPFQLAFVCLNIPSLTRLDHSERSGLAHGGLVDLLFFPTGGGKTEAYLGLVAYTFGIRRLQGEVAGHDGGDGVAVLMRYTLRALTTQQFERAASLVCATERLRVDEPETWGSTPFRLGMWVGSSVSPMSHDESVRQVQNAKGSGFQAGGTPLQLSSCPWCGCELELGRDVDAANGWDRTLLYCSDPSGACPFTRRLAPTEGIPVVTVDEEIYRLLPSFIIGTVDKFAQLPWYGATGMLFGRVDKRCDRHGYRSTALEEQFAQFNEPASRHNATGSLPAADANIPAGPLRPPDLIIQDELHLITGSLGTMVGLYETAVDRLCTWEVEGRQVRPKVLASTATIRRAREQALRVFDRETRIFPPAVLDTGDSFFARQVSVDAENPGRLYLGVCAHGLRLKSVENRVFATVMSAAQATYEKYGAAADPWMTAVGYFGSVRELAGMKRLADDETRRRLLRMDAIEGLASRGGLRVEEMTSRRASSEIRPLLDDLGTPFDPEADDDAPKPIDLLLATNMISVGVDVPRLGLMVNVGQPKSTAEYIQATSRVGRSRRGPGLVVTVYQWTRPRDLSHYESFEHFHATFYRQVEPLSVTPFAERALDRGLSAVLIALLRNLFPKWNPAAGAQQIDRLSPEVAAVAEGIVARAAGVTGSVAVGQLVSRALRNRLDQLQSRQRQHNPHLVYSRKDPMLLRKPEEGEWTDWTCPLSLRNTEPNVQLQIDESPITTPAPPFEAMPKPAAGKADGGSV